MNSAIEEELSPAYSPANFYHADPGEILNGRFKLISKVGFGAQSTVWLANDISWRMRSFVKPYVVIKINANDAGSHESNHELQICQHISSSAAWTRGRHFLRLVDEHFDLSGPHGKHTCLVQEPLREPLLIFRRRFGADRVMHNSLPVFKILIGHILRGLACLHDQCHVVHTDLKLDNILVSVEAMSILDDFVNLQASNPMPRKAYADRNVYLSHNLLGDLKLSKAGRITAKIIDFDLAQRADGTGPNMFPIQTAAYSAPEVVLGIGWSYSVDIWNLGLMIWTLLAGKDLVDVSARDGAGYSARRFLAAVISLLGEVPADMVERERSMRGWRWAPEIINHQGRACDNALDYYGGPFFDDDGRFISKGYDVAGHKLGTFLPDCITNGEKDVFLDFMHSMLRWLPEERATAQDLLRHPWLKTA